MKRLSNRKFRLGYNAKLLGKNGEVVESISCRIKSKVLDFLATLSDKEGLIYIKVEYGKPHGHNDSEHKTVQGAIDALNAYTEKQFLDYLEE